MGDDVRGCSWLPPIGDEDVNVSCDGECCLLWCCCGLILLLLSAALADRFLQLDTVSLSSPPRPVDARGGGGVIADSGDAAELLFTAAVVVVVVRILVGKSVAVDEDATAVPSLPPTPALLGLRLAAMAINEPDMETGVLGVPGPAAEDKLASKLLLALAPPPLPGRSNKLVVGGGRPRLSDVMGIPLLTAAAAAASAAYFCKLLLPPDAAPPLPLPLAGSL